MPIDQLRHAAELLNFTGQASFPLANSWHDLISRSFPDHNAHARKVLSATAESLVIHNAEDFSPDFLYHIFSSVTNDGSHQEPHYWERVLVAQATRDGLPLLAYLAKDRMERHSLEDYVKCYTMVSESSLSFFSVLFE